jgi:hypothetical protein
VGEDSESAGLRIAAQAKSLEGNPASQVLPKSSSVFDYFKNFNGPFTDPDNDMIDND